jgi:ABC-type Fe3+/spermidine/putrescine transport system ATPase subunit
MEHPHVAIRNVTKTFGNFKALDSVSLEIAQGSFTTLLGPSGCGKTTLLRSIAGFYQIDEGEISIDGRVINSIPSHLRNAIMVFQDYALFPHMTIRENITYGLRIRKMPREEIERRLEKTVHYLDIGMLLDRMPGQISGGQQQRVALARALIMEPEVLLLDEPLSNLDANLRNAIRAELRQLQQRLRITTIYVTHDQAEALAMSDSIAVLNAGKIIQIGSPAEIYYHPANRFVASFVGTVNFIEGSITDIDEQHIHAEAKGLPILIERRKFDAEAIGSLERSKKVLLVIRPESMKILDSAQAQKDAANIFQGEIDHYIFEGSNIRYWISALDSMIIVDMFDPGEADIRNGMVRFRIDPSKVHLIAL